MKQKLKALVLLLFAGSMLLLQSCEKDLYEEPIKQNKRYVMKEVSLKDKGLINDQKLLGAISNLKQKQSVSTGKIVYDSIKNFWYDDEKGLYIDDGTTHSYTFDVERENSDNKIEKLVFQSLPDGDYKTLLVKYDYTEEELKYMNELQLAQETVTTTDITGRCGEMSVAYICNYIYSQLIITQYGYPPCDQPGVPHENGQKCQSQIKWVITGGDCSYDVSIDNSGCGGGGDGFASTPSSNGGDGDIGDGNGAPDPCDKLKNLKNINVVGLTEPKTVGDCMTQLTQALSEPAVNFEVGFWMQQTTNPNEVVQNFFQGQPNGNSVENINVGQNSVTIIMHTHYDDVNQLPVFSLQDLYQIYELLNNQNITGSFTAILITKHGTRYALNFEDPSLFTAFGDTFFAGWEFDNIRYQREKIYKNKGIDPKNSIDENEKGFLEFVKQYNTGLSLYKTDNNFTDWKKLYLDNNNLVKEISCL